MATTTQTHNKAYTEAQLAEKWNLSRKTLQAWRLNGGGPVFVKFGKAVRYLEIDVAAFEDINRFGSTAQSEAAQ